MEINFNYEVGRMDRNAIQRPSTRYINSPSVVTQFEETEAMHQALKASPDARPEKVDEAMGLKAQVKYPPDEIIVKIANLLSLKLNTLAQDNQITD